MEKERINEEEMRDPVEVAREITGRQIKLEVEVEGAVWMREEEKKLFLMELKK